MVVEDIALVAMALPSGVCVFFAGYGWETNAGDIHVILLAC